MRFKLRTLFVVTFVVAVLAIGVGSWVNSVGGISEFLWVCVAGEETEWAPDYTDDGFLAVELGMTRAEVHALLGKPLDTWENYGGAELVDSWTQGANDLASYRQRAVVFRGGRAVEKVSEFWVD